MKNKKLTVLEIENIGYELVKSVGDDGLFPNYTDENIWVDGFKSGINFIINEMKKYETI